MMQDVDHGRSSCDQQTSRGQSMLEFALFLPFLLLLIAGLVEIGAYANVYMTFLDASREAARFGSNIDPGLTSKYWFDMRPGHEAFPDVTNLTPAQLRTICRQGETTNFYYEVACVAFENLPLGSLDPAQGDDIVITVIGVKDGNVSFRWPQPSQRNISDQTYHFAGAANGEYCWSLYGVRTSGFSTTDLAARLRSDAPDTGFVIVEVFHAQPQFTRLFTIGQYIPDPVPMRVFSVFPVAAAEPD